LAARRLLELHPKCLFIGRIFATNEVLARVLHAAWEIQENS
jgi:hypothetical protein